MRFIDSILLYVSVGLALFASCADPEVEIVHLQEPITVNSVLDRNPDVAMAITRDYRKSYVSSLYRSFGVGYGYCAFEGYADYDAVRDVVINLDSLLYYEELEHYLCLIDDRSPHAYQNVMKGEDSEKLLKSLSANAGLSADLKFFQAEVKGSYASSDLKSNYYSFCTIHTGMVLGSRHLDPLSLAELCRRHPTILAPGLRCLMEEARTAILDNNLAVANDLVEMLYSIYGTHLLYHADLGGRLTFMSTFERASLDSKSDLSASAQVNLMSLLNYSISEGEQNTLKQTSTNSKKRITAIGGDVTIVSKILFANDSLDAQNSLSAGVVEEWFKSVRLNFDSIGKNNTELIEIKLYPLDEFILALGNEPVSAFLLQRIGQQLEYEDGLFPRVYEHLNAQISTSALWQPSSTQLHTIHCGNEVVGELDYECIRGREFVTFYPTIEGALCHEGIARGYGTDSLYLITWHDTIPYITRLCPITEIPYLYYSDGYLDIVPDSTQIYSNCEVKQVSTYMWTSNTSAVLKVGSQMLMQGAYATMSNLSYTNYATVIRDLPLGYAEVTVTDMEILLNQIRKNYVRCPDMLRGKQWLLRQENESSPSAAFIIDDDMKLKKVEQAYYGFILCRRTFDFRYP